MSQNIPKSLQNFHLPSKSHFRKQKTKIKINQFEDYIQLGVTEKDLLYYKEIFDLYDIKKKGYIAPNDLRSVMKLFGYSAKKETIYKIISELDNDETGGISFEEFLKIMTDKNRPCDQDCEEDYEFVFRNIDQNNKGYLDRNDVKKLFMEMNQKISENDLNILFERLDPKNKGIDFLSFYENLQDLTFHKMKI